MKLACTSDNTICTGIYTPTDVGVHEITCTATAGTESASAKKYLEVTECVDRCDLLKATGIDAGIKWKEDTKETILTWDVSRIMGSGIMQGMNTFLEGVSVDADVSGAQTANPAGKYDNEGNLGKYTDASNYELAIYTIKANIMFRKSTQSQSEPPVWSVTGCGGYPGWVDKDNNCLKSLQSK